MIHLKSFINFINEGAWYEGDPGNPPNADMVKVFLSTKNDSNNPNELLKTVEPNGKNFHKRGSIKVYHGLHPRINYNKENQESQLAKDLIMDNLKKAKESNFSIAPGEKLEDFIDYTLLKNIKGDVNYIVRVGSSADLVSVMSDSLQKIYPNALFIDLNKIKYESGEDGVDWDEYNKKVESELSKPRINRRTGEIAPPHSRTQDYVKNWIIDRNNQLLQLIDDGKEPWFHIKSSGVQAGIRSALRPKYDTASDAFINAVHHCAFGDENGKLGKMILIDDNANEGIDFRNISNKVYEILAGIIDITKNNTQEVLKSQGILDKIKSEYERRNIGKKLDTQLDNFLKTDVMDNIENNIIGYVLYDFNKITKREDLDNVDYIEALKKAISEVVSPFISKRIEDGRSFEMTRNDYANSVKNIISISLNNLSKRSTDNIDTIKEKLENTFKSSKEIIFPAYIIAERPTVPKYPDTAHLVDGTLVRNLTTGWIGKLVNVDQIDGVTKIEYEGKGKTGNTSLQFILNKSKFDLL
jgi:hypothetical protein